MSQQDFSPALLAITERPPSPLPRAVLALLLALVVAFILMIVLGRVDRVAVASGRFVPASYVQVVQPAVPGVIRALPVREGQRVAAGDVVAVLDAAAASARSVATSTDLARSALALERIDAELEVRPFHSDKQYSDELVAKVNAQFEANRLAQRGLIAQEQSALARTRSEQQAIAARVEELIQTSERLRQEEQAIAQLLVKGYVSRLQSLEKERERISAEQQLIAERHRLESAAAAIAQQGKRLQAVSEEYRRALQQERAAALAEHTRLTAASVESSVALAATELRAPMAGRIKDLSTHTLGSVVDPGSVLMTIVPEPEPLNAEVWIDNADISYMQEGLAVRVKIDAIDFRRYGALDGRVTHISADATTRESVGNATPSSDGTHEQPDRYRALVAIDADAARNRLGKLELSAGMTLRAEILVGQRSILEYLLSPVRKVSSEAGQEI